MKKTIETITIGILLIAVLVLSIISLNTDFRVSGYNVYTNRNVVSLFFNEPVSKDLNLNDYISVSPESSFKVTNLGNRAEIIFDHILLGTKYEISVSNSLLNIFGKAIKENSSVSFNSKHPTLAFYNKDGNTSFIKSYDLQRQHEEILYSTENVIKGFSIKNNFLLVNEQPSLTDTKLVLINVSSKQTIKTIELEGKTSFKADLAADGSFFVYMSQNVRAESDFVIPLGPNELTLVNINNNSVADINFRKITEDVLDVFVTPDSSALLIRGYDSTFYIKSAHEDDEPVTLSKFIGTGGFDNKGQRVIFSSFDPTQVFTSYPFITIYNSDRTTEDIRFTEAFITDPTFYEENSVMYAKKLKDLNGTPGIFGIFKYVEGQETSVLESPDLYESFELPKLSSDSQYICYERYSQMALLDFNNQRNFINQRKPKDADISVRKFGATSDQITFENAYDCQWY